MSSKDKNPPGGEALRRRLTDFWKRWDDNLRAQLEEKPNDKFKSPFINLDVLTIVSERDFPNGKELGQLSWDAYQKALELEASLKKKLEALGGTVGAQIAKEISAYGAERELAGYRGAQLEMLVADHVANLKATAKGNIVKTTKGDKRVQQLADFLRDNSLTMMIPTQLARMINHREKINQKIPAFAMLGPKQFERDMIEAFGILRSRVLNLR